MEAAAIALVSGATYAVAARAAGVDVRTLHRWRKSSPDFARALDAAKIERMRADCDPSGWSPLVGVGRTLRPEVESDPNPAGHFIISE